MSNQKIIDRARDLFVTKCRDRDDQLEREIQNTFKNLGSRNVLRSSIASNDISKVLSNEFKIRTDISWQSLYRSLEIGDIEALETLNSDLKEELQRELNQERQAIINIIKNKLRNMNLLEYMKEIESSLSHIRNLALSKHGAEINLYIDNLQKKMKRLGIYESKDRKIYDLVYFPGDRLGQAIGPLPERVGVAGVAAEVHTPSEIEAEKLLVEKLSGIEKKGPSFVTTTTSLSGVSSTTTTTLPPELINADPETANKNASELIIQDNPDLTHIQDVVAQHLKPLLSGVSLEEKLDSESVRKAEKVEINIKYAPNLYIGKDAYFGNHIGSMGPTLQKLDLSLNQVWQDLKISNNQNDVADELRRLAKKLDALEDQIDHLQDAAIVEKAAAEISAGNGPKALKLLSSVSKEILSVSKEIGTNLATDLIMKMLGLK